MPCRTAGNDEPGAALNTVGATAMRRQRSEFRAEGTAFVQAILAASKSKEINRAFDCLARFSG